MVLDKWTTGDLIAEIQANNRGIRKGTVTELDGISAGEREDGVYFWNSTDDTPQVLANSSNNLRGNLHTLLGADTTEVSVLGIGSTKVKDLDFIISHDSVSDVNLGFGGNFLYIVAMAKASANNCELRIKVDGGPELVLDTSSTSYTRVQGVIDIGPGGQNLTKGDTTCVHTLEAFLDNSSGGSTAYLKEFEVYGL